MNDSTLDVPISHAAAARKRGQKNGKTRCQPLGEQCRRAVAEICGDELDPQPCLEAHAVCCGHFAQRRVIAGVECIIAND